MINTACTFIQYLNNKNIDGHKKIIGFTIDKGLTVIHFCKFPTFKELMGMVEIWQTFETDNSFKIKVN